MDTLSPQYAGVVDQKVKFSELFPAKFHKGFGRLSVSLYGRDRDF
jgi:hypothetical protein